MRTRFLLILSSLAFITLSACTSAPPVGDIPASIATAATSADHQRIADYFSRKAASYDAESAMHKKMALSYGSRPKGDPAAMTAHCQALETQFSNAAKEARALEQAHRQLASSTGK